MPCVLQLWTSPPCRCGLRRCHVSHDPGPRFSARMGSSAATCPVPLGLSSEPRRASMLSHIPWLWTPPPCWGGIWCCHAPRNSLWTAGLRYKECLSWPSYASRLACFQDALVCFQGVWRPNHYGLQDVWAGGLHDVRTGSNSIVSTLLTTHRTLLQCEMTRQDDAIPLTMRSMAERRDSTSLMSLKTSFATSSRWCPTILGSSHTRATCWALGHNVTATTLSYQRPGRWQIEISPFRPVQHSF
jgi:hypothetical protein